MTSSPSRSIARFFASGMRLQHLRVMVALQELGGVGKAAQALHITQSAVSKQIAEIENTMGIALFYRERNRLYLTEAGKRLATHAQTVLQQLHRAELEIQALSSGLSGHIRVGTVTSLAPTLLAHAVTLFKEAAPQVSVAVVEGHFVSLKPLLDRGEIDLAVARIWQPQDLPEIAQEVLSVEPIVVVCARNHPLAKRRKLTWQDAAAWPWILPEVHSIARRAIEAFWAQQDLPSPADVIEAQSLPLNMALIQQMPRLCLMPESLAMTQAARGEVAVLSLRLGEVLAEARCYWRHDLLLHNEAARLFVECLKSASLSATGKP